MYHQKFSAVLSERGARLLNQDGPKGADSEKAQVYEVLQSLINMASRMSARHLGLWDDIVLATQSIALGASASLIFIKMTQVIPEGILKKARIFGGYDIFEVGWVISYVIISCLIVQSFSSLVIGREAERDAEVFREAAASIIKDELTKQKADEVLSRLDAGLGWKIANFSWKWARRVGLLSTLLFIFAVYLAVR